MYAYSNLSELESDLDYARKNPRDEAFFSKILERYKNAPSETRALLKKALFDKMLEHNPTYIIKKIAEDNPTKILYLNSEQDPFFTV